MKGFDWLPTEKGSELECSRCGKLSCGYVLKTEYTKLPTYVKEGMIMCDKCIAVKPKGKEIAMSVNLNVLSAMIEEEKKEGLWKGIEHNL